MSRIQVNSAVIVDLLKWGISAGADIVKARQTLQANGVDPAVYQSVIDDKRTFKDFHGANPKSDVVPPPAPEPTPGDGGKDDAPPASSPLPPAPAPYGTWMTRVPSRADGFEQGDHIYRRSAGGTIQYQVDYKANGTASGPGFEYFGDIQ